MKKVIPVEEHERIEEMKVDFQNAEAARREGQIGSCPTCPGKLEKYAFMGFILNRCDRCQGIWLKLAELRGIVRQAARGPVGAFLDRCFPGMNRTRRVSFGLIIKGLTQVEITKEAKKPHRKIGNGSG